MSHHHKLGKETTCLNCGHEVEDRYCPHCGQENIEPRQPFHYLFGHFVEDLTHYDHGFWETFKTLMLRPGKLIKNYLEGKRASQMAPVKLYIFVSFLAFFIPVILPEHHSEEKQETKKEIHNVTKKKDAIVAFEKAKQLPFFDTLQKKLIQHQIDSLKQVIEQPVDSSKDDDDDLNIDIEQGSIINLSKHYQGLHTVREIDSVQNALPPAQKPDRLSYSLNRKYIEFKEKGLSNKEILEKFYESALHNFPKLLFFYLPFFAFLMWLTHKKRKFFYFDHGIFTLYYFSFILTSVILMEIINWIGGFFHNGFIHSIKDILYAILIIYPFIYFFIADRRVYRDSKSITIVRGLFLLFLNGVCMLFFLVGFIILIGYLLH